MANLTIEKYFADNYGKWLRRANTLCYSYYTPRDNAEDILHDAVRVVLEKESEQDLLYLLSEQCSNNDKAYTLLDLYVSRTISNKLMHFNQHRKVVQRKKADIDVNLLNVTENQYTPRYDVYEQQQHLNAMIDKMEADNMTKSILKYRLTDNNPLSRFRGVAKDKKRHLYHTGLQQLQASL